MKMISWMTASLLGLLLVTGDAAAQGRTRVKDVATLSGIEDLQIFGYGLVVGLAGTGDKSQTVFTTRTTINMLKSMGIELPEKYIRIRNVAAVIATGTLSPYKRKGTRLDVTVSSLGDATSLEGGTLVLTPLQAADGVVYGTAQGPLTTGGFDVRNRTISYVKKNHVLVGRIPDGAIVQHQVNLDPINKRELSLSLNTPDFTSSQSMADAINARFKEIVGKPIASPLDAGTVRIDFQVVEKDTAVKMPLVDFISTVENVEFDVANRARIVVNEKTGTIVAGGNVKISEVAVSHGGIKVEIVNTPEVVQPQPFTEGTTTVIPQPQMVVEEKEPDMVVMHGTTTVADLAQSLNSLGVTPRDIISIFQAIKEAGALQGQLIVM